MSTGKSKNLGSKLIEISRNLAIELDELKFGGKVHVVYNPTVYARELHEAYLRSYGNHRGAALLLGMNPGPWGMAQTGVPFGEVNFVRDWMELRGVVDKPVVEHPKRPVTGLACTRSEVSGQRLWSWAKERFGTPGVFFSHFFVWNYCPLSFMVESGANLTPDKLSSQERAELYRLCDLSLGRVVEVLEPKAIVGVGKFAQTRARRALPDYSKAVETVLHPSPASPIANRGWAPQADARFVELGLLPRS